MLAWSAVCRQNQHLMLAAVGFVCRARSCLDAKLWYTLHITTSDIRGAGTDADVHIALSSSQGSSGIVALPSQPQQYQRGQRDKFRCGAWTYCRKSCQQALLGHTMLVVPALSGQPFWSRGLGPRAGSVWLADGPCAASRCPSALVGVLAGCSCRPWVSCRSC